jgi:hypothetical protein
MLHLGLTLQGHTARQSVSLVTSLAYIELADIAVLR